MKHLVSKFSASSLLRIAAITGLGLTASGCVYDGGIGLGYASDGYDSGYGCDGYNDFDSYYGCDSGYGFSNIGYGGGWYSNYYYPGYGYYVFDSYGRRFQMHNDHRRYWGGQRYNWHRQHGRGHGRGDGRGHGRGNGHGNHDNNGGGNNYGGHNGGGRNHGNGGGRHGNGDYSDNNNREPRRGMLDGGFGQRGRRSDDQRGGSIQNPIVNNPAVNNDVNVAPPPRNIDRGNRRDRGNGMLNGGFGRQRQDNGGFQGRGSEAPVVRQAPQVDRAPSAPAAPRSAPAPRAERTETLRRPQEK